MKNGTKKKKNKASVAKCAKTETFDDSVQHKYRAIVVSSPIASENTIEFFVKNNHEDGHLTYDDVEDVAYRMLEVQYPQEYYPKSELERIEIEFDGNWYPVLRESDKKGISKMKRSAETCRFLVLPDAVYAFTPEFEAYYKLLKKGVVNEIEINFDKFRQIYVSIKDSDSPLKDK